MSTMKPITLTTEGRKHSLSVKGEPVLSRADGGMTWKGQADFEPSLSVLEFKTIEDAMRKAHLIGCYFLGLGDFVHSYVHRATTAPKAKGRLPSPAGEKRLSRWVDDANAFFTTER